MDNRSNGATRRGTIIANAERAATDKLIQATDGALSRLWSKYDDGDLRELASSLATGRAAPIVARFDADLGRIFGGDG